MILKKLMSHFELNVFSGVGWILSQLTAFFLKLQQKNLHEQKSTVWKTALIPHYSLTRMMPVISRILESLAKLSNILGYIYLSTFSLFSTSLFPLKWVISVSSLKQ